MWLKHIVSLTIQCASFTGVSIHSTTLFLVVVNICKDVFSNTCSLLVSFDIYETYVFFMLLLMSFPSCFFRVFFFVFL